MTTQPASVAPAARRSSPPNVLSIAGVDPSGGAGVLADLKTFSALGAYGCGVVAALTAQNTQGVTGIYVPPPEFLRLQLDTLFADIPIAASKIGMLGGVEAIAAVADRLSHWDAQQVVLDPVMVAKSGDPLLPPDAMALLREMLLPRAFLITPNLPEAGALLGCRAAESKTEMMRMAEKLRALLPLDSERWVLLKGGHLPGDTLVDLFFDGEQMIEFPARRVMTRNTHGTGCALSSALAALLPQRTQEAQPVVAAVRRAHAWLNGAIARADTLAVGRGHGPVHHFYDLWT
ncbi:MAG: bifunctional hydroxymethylpyrimidine kinase/phosphomethylpyrimidine kinase [Zoogloeaceae bacterium]|jgi:hydroxymethylpyrimidine/phosphomethylpyrimidine kinase|nr:bifunctional hydroxymethylpyrimidine kinase/phosphomethylpyrimidine kinase [Zoogloeaceae bacterium]